MDGVSLLMMMGYFIIALVLVLVVSVSGTVANIVKYICHPMTPRMRAFSAMAFLVGVLSFLIGINIVNPIIPQYGVLLALAFLILCLMMGRGTIDIINPINPKIGIFLALALFVGPLCLMIGSLTLNPMYPNSLQAQAVSFYNTFGIMVSLLGLALSVFAYRKNIDMMLAKYTTKFGVASVIILVVLFQYL